MTEPNGGRCFTTITTTKSTTDASGKRVLVADLQCAKRRLETVMCQRVDRPQNSGDRGQRARGVAPPRCRRQRCPVKNWPCINMRDTPGYCSLLRRLRHTPRNLCRAHDSLGHKSKASLYSSSTHRPASFVPAHAFPLCICLLLCCRLTRVATVERALLASSAAAAATATAPTTATATATATAAAAATALL